MRKKVGFKFLLFISLFILPMMVFASDNNTDFVLGLPEALFIEAFVSIHMSVFVLMPLAKILSTDYKKMFWKLFVIRAGILLFFDFFVTTSIAFVDFFGVFIGAIFVLPIAYGIKGKKHESTNSTESTISVQSVQQNTGTVNQQTNPMMLKCPKCGKELAQGNKWCSACGTQSTGVTNVNASPTQKTITLAASTGIPFNRSEYDPVFFQSEKQITLSLIDKALKGNSTVNRVKIPEIENRKTIFTLIYLIIFFVLAVIFFLYHVYDTTIILLFFITIVYVFLLSKYNLKNYLLKQVQSRPDEKIHYVVSSILSGNASTSVISPAFGRIAMFLGVFLILGALFWEPHFIFEKAENGYAVRYYTIGISGNDTVVSIPSSYKGEAVVGIRGDVFRNLESLEYVEIPDTVTEIRGGAFQDCSSLKEINLPPHITEIRGSTFENCRSLEKIEIPEGVTRIGGSAFRNCYRLHDVVIPKTVTEIGSSAFRDTGINRVCISRNTDVNERAFKETYANIVYYENGCVDNYEYNNGYDNEYNNGYNSEYSGYDDGYNDGYNNEYSGY